MFLCLCAEGGPLSAHDIPRGGSAGAVVWGPWCGAFPFTLLWRLQGRMAVWVPVPGGQAVGLVQPALGPPGDSPAWAALWHCMRVAVGACPVGRKHTAGRTPPATGSPANTCCPPETRVWEVNLGGSCSGLSRWDLSENPSLLFFLILESAQFSCTKHWVDQKVHMVSFGKIKTFLIFTNNRIDLDVLSVSVLSCLVEHCLFPVTSPFDRSRLQWVCPTAEHRLGGTSSVKLHKPLPTRSISRSACSVHCASLFLCSVAFLLFLKQQSIIC